MPSVEILNGQDSLLVAKDKLKLVIDPTFIGPDGLPPNRRDWLKEQYRKTPPVPHDFAEPQLTENGLTIAIKSYLGRDEETGQVNETPQEMVFRIAHNVATADIFYDPSEFEKTRREFYETIAGLDFVPNTPTIANAGRKLQQLSACFVLPIKDDLEDIFEKLKQTVMIHKTGGGTGFDFSDLRPMGSLVRSTGRTSSGAVLFLWAYADVTDRVQQGGYRRGANMGILNIHHPDILRFMAVKSEEHTLNPFNLSVAVTREFMHKVEEDNQYAPDGLAPQMGQVDQIINRIQEALAIPQTFTNKVAAFEKELEALQELVSAKVEGEGYSVINPDTQKVEARYNARKVFDLIARLAWEKGDPGIIFLDRINEDNPTPALGQIKATNPCGEQPLLPYESCNLGAVNLARMVKDHQVDWEKLRRVVGIGVHFLDNVIDMNRYPLPQIEAMTRGNRKVGLGIMGFADMLVQLGIPYDSEKGLATAERVMDFIREETRKMSQELAVKRGVFPNFEGSIYDDHSPNFKGDALKLRNAALTTIAPTGTTSLLAGANSGIEPFYSIAYEKNLVSGEKIPMVNPYFIQIAKERGFWDEDLMTKIIANNGSVRGLEGVPEDIQRVFSVAPEITPEWHVRMQAAFQKHVDNAISKTINLSNSATPKDIEEAYRLAFEEGCKGITIYRDGSRTEQILNTAEEELFIRPIPEVMKAVTRIVKVKSENNHEPPILQATINEDEDGSPLKISVDEIGKSGTDILSAADAIAKVVSLGLQSVKSSQALIKMNHQAEQLLGIGGSSNGSDLAVSTPDGLARIFGWYLKGKVLPEEEMSIRSVPDKVSSKKYSKDTGAGKVHVFVDRDQKGFILDVFITIGKSGKEVLNLTEALGRMVSLELRTTPAQLASQKLGLITEQLRGIGGRTPVGFGEKQVLSVADAVAQIFEEVLEEEGQGVLLNIERRDLCPECGNHTLVWQEGCKKCTCGYSQC